MESIPRVLFIEFVHESLDNGQSLIGAEQQVAFYLTRQVDPIRSLLLKINIFDFESLAPSGVVIYVIGLSRIFFQRWFLWVEAAVVFLQVCEPGVVVGVDVGQI